MVLLIPVFTLGLTSFLYAETFHVGCSVDDLISAINQANATPGVHTLELSGGCIYTLTVECHDIVDKKRCHNIVEFVL